MMDSEVGLLGGVFIRGVKGVAQTLAGSQNELDHVLFSTL